MSESSNEYGNFKKLLEYFVAHLEYCVNGDEKSRGYSEYIKKLIENDFRQTGQGYRGHAIQKQIGDWEQYGNERICITVQPTYGSYRTTRCYLNWMSDEESTGVNVVAKWDGDKINGFYQIEFDGMLERRDLGCNKSIIELGLFDGKKEVTEDLKFFFDEYNKHLLAFKEKKKSNRVMIDKIKDLLLANKNLILTGAPGTGKTYLAKAVARALGAETEFVQFHPSYDYTDFVEGLRPTKPDDNGNIGFELRGGIFKVFCEQAAQNFIDSRKEGEDLSMEADIEEAIDSFLETAIDEGTEFEIKTGNKFSVVEHTRNGIRVSIPDNTKTKEIDLSVRQLMDLLITREKERKNKRNFKLEKVIDIKRFFNRKHNTQHDSYIFILYNGIIKSGKIGVSKGKQENKGKQEKIEEKIYLFIIDEINRAEISKVFGELFYSIDPGYRGEEGRVKTQYANLQPEGEIFSEGFYVPENVHILGTMNDIDRSVESFDFAMRRRFAWEEIKAEDNTAMWEGVIDLWKEEAGKRMAALNKAIEEIPGLNSAYHIGPSYFLKLKLESCKGDFNRLWEYHLRGVLFEYLRGMSDSGEKLDTLKNAYDNPQKVQDKENHETPTDDNGQ